MSPSNNTRSGSTENSTISNESNTRPTSTSSYTTQTGFVTTTEKILSSFNDNNVKQYAKSKESISEKDAKFDAKFEKQLQTLSLHIQEDNTYI